MISWTRSIVQSRTVQSLAAARFRIAVILTIVMIAVYFSFVALVAFNKPFLAQRVGRGLSVGILLGALVIVISWITTWIYIRWANRHYDPHIEALRKP